MQEPVEVTLGGTDKVYYIPLEEMLQKLLTNELVLEEVYVLCESRNCSVMSWYLKRYFLCESNYLYTN